MNIKDALRPLLGEYAEQVKKSYDVIGTVAIIEVPDEVKQFEKIIARTILSRMPYITTVCKKAGEREGCYRLRKIQKIAGNGTETIHKEYGYKLFLDVKKAYFSPRESTERQRIASQVKKNETVLVMFAGIGPYCFAIAKAQPTARVYGIESNPQAVKFFEENVKLNATSFQVTPLLGDVKQLFKEFQQSCDRVVMPLPKNGYRFLTHAFSATKPGGIIHFYSIGDRNDPFAHPLKQLKNTGKTYTILNKQRVLPYGPGKQKICLDVQVT